MSDETTPTHTCEIQGLDTKYTRTVNVKTGERGWICAWCEIANKMKNNL